MLQVIKSALEDENLAMLNASQFGRVLKMGSHTFFVMVVHYLLSRQFVTEKDFQLWWFFVGKPIRYAIQDFVLVTGLNCGEIDESTRQDNRKGLGQGNRTRKVKASTSSQSIWNTSVHLPSAQVSVYISCLFCKIT
ncbi:hypothetical protein BRARA_D00613 [Brassica rapa]|uniref:DUF1985 domain-containing protein n=1 Tax=Brassica campestris TaxID=3711 RepID=A0A397ZIG6_BRACM|nr:hypothetical protein BRARA_D00613 [Brassica rapa]